MTQLATRSNKLSAVLAFEELPEHGYCRDTATVTVEAGMDIGAALQLVAGKYVWIEAADVATLGANVAVLIDNANDVVNLAAGDHSLTVLVRGPAGVTDDGLTFKDALSAPQELVVQAALEAKGIVIRTQV